MRPNRFHPTVEALEERLPLSANGLIPASLKSLLATVPNFFNRHAHQARNTFVGQAAGSDDLVAVVVGRQQALAYVCDGHSFSAWLHGPAAGARLRLTDARGDALKARLAGGTLAGSLTLAGQPSLALKASRAVNGQSGLFRGTVQLGQEPSNLSLIRLGDQAHGVILPIKVVCGTTSRLTGCTSQPPPPPPPPPPSPPAASGPSGDNATPPILVGVNGQPVTLPDPSDFDNLKFVSNFEDPILTAHGV
jgi:hypothetical protein